MENMAFFHFLDIDVGRAESRQYTDQNTHTIEVAHYKLLGRG